MIPRSGFYASRFFLIACFARNFFSFTSVLIYVFNGISESLRDLSWNRRFDEVKQKKQKFKTGVNFSSFCLDAKRTKRSRLESFTSVLFNVFIGVSESLRDLSKKMETNSKCFRKLTSFGQGNICFRFAQARFYFHFSSRKWFLGRGFSLRGFFNCLLRSQFFFLYFSAYLCFQWNRWITSWFALKQNGQFFYYLLLS